MALYKILAYNTRNIHTFSGVISGNSQNGITGVISGEISGKISGEISGHIYGINYVASNLQTYSGVASGLISGEIEGTISDIISGTITQQFSNTISGIISTRYCVPGLSFLRDENEEEFDWTCTSISVLKEKLLYLYKYYPQEIFIPVHVLKEELDLSLDGCIGG